MSEYTKGPWLVNKDNVTSPMGIICTVRNKNTGVLYRDDAADANAKLIAAAPELLDCLERILNASESDNNGAYMGEAVLCKYFTTMAKSIIAKAKGE